MPTFFPLAVFLLAVLISCLIPFAIPFPLLAANFPAFIPKFFNPVAPKPAIPPTKPFALLPKAPQACCARPPSAAISPSLPLIPPLLLILAPNIVLIKGITCLANVRIPNINNAFIIIPELSSLATVGNNFNNNEINDTEINNKNTCIKHLIYSLNHVFNISVLNK